MTEEKVKRTISAATVAGVLLIIILVAVMVYQLLAIKSRKREVDFYDAQIAALQQQIAGAETEQEKWMLEWQIQRRLRELGYYFPGDKFFEEKQGL